MEESSTTEKEKHQQTPPPISYSPCFLIQQLRAAYLKCLGMEEDITKEVLEESKSPKTNGKEANPEALVPGATPSPEEGSVTLPVSTTADPTDSDPDGSSAINADSVAAEPAVNNLPADASDDPPASAITVLSAPSGSSVSTGSGPQHN